MTTNHLTRSLSAVLAMLMLGSQQAQARPLSDADARALIGQVDARKGQLAANARKIWEWAEVGFREERSTALLQEQLKAAGFTIQPGISGIPTAFVATYGNSGPVLAYLAEYDALPGLSQTDTPQQASRGGEAGHACGHNLLGTASVEAAISLARWLKQTGTPGTIRVYGSPAEEGGSAKVYFVRDGLFTDVDAVLSWHPSSQNGASQGSMLAVLSVKFRFQGVASHAAAAPERGARRSMRWRSRMSRSIICANMCRRIRASITRSPMAATSPTSCPPMPKASITSAITTPMWCAMCSNG
jgi:aminobenzoyl-glutamate utilization protein B